MSPDEVEDSSDTLREHAESAWNVENFLYSAQDVPDSLQN